MNVGSVLHRRPVDVWRRRLCLVPASAWRRHRARPQPRQGGGSPARQSRRGSRRSHGGGMDASHGRQHRARGAAQADNRPCRSADQRVSHSCAEFHRHHDVRRLAAGRASPPARAAAPEGAVRQRTAVVRPAGSARAGDDRAVQRGDGAREVRDEQARADLYPLQRSRVERSRHAEEPEGGAHSPDAQLGHVARRVSA